MLSEGVAALDLKCSPEKTDKLQNFLSELEIWNQHYHFVHVKSRDGLITHIIDALTGVHLIALHSQGGTILDIGSGVGFPGIPLSIVLDDCQFVLLERSLKKVAFLRNTVLMLGLNNVEVLCADLKHIQRQFQVVTFRAFAPLDRAYEQCYAVVKPNGKIVAYKGRLKKTLAELKSLQDKVDCIEVQRVRVPFLPSEHAIERLAERLAERHLVVLTKD